MIENVTIREQPANPRHINMQNLEFRLMLMQNHYTNPNSFHLCFPIKIRKRISVNDDIDNYMITANNFFAQWIKKISVTRLLLTSSPYEIYQYSDAMLKYLPEKSLKTMKNYYFLAEKR